MSERLSVKEIITEPKAVAALLLSAVAIAGCGVTRAADNEPIGMCGNHDYSKAANPLKSSQTRAQVVSTAEQDALILHRRALNVGDNIDLPHYGDNDSGENVTEVTASSDSLRLNFDRSNDFEVIVDHVDFTIKGSSTDISEGAVLCYDTNNQQVVTNGTFQTLETYVNETAGLDK